MKNIYLSLFLVPFLAACGGGSSSSSSSNSVKSYSLDEVFSKQTISSKNSLVNLKKEDVLNGFLEFPEEQTLLDEDAIKQYLQNKYSISLKDNPSIKKSLHFTSYKFVQDNVKALECGSSINITLDKDNKVFKTYIFKIDDFNTCKRADSYFEKPRAYTASEAPSLNEGTLVSKSIKVFDPDPITSSKGQIDTATSLDSLVISDTNYFTKSVDALQKDGKVYFSNNQVKAIDIEKMQNSTQGAQEDVDNKQGVFFIDSSEDFLHVFKEKNFLDQMAFYHLSDSISYLNTLGYKNEFAIFTEPLKFDTQVSSGNESQYLSDIKVLSLGLGGLADANDADVLRHELAHAINYHIVKDFNGGDTGAIGEGFADYWAGYHSYFIQKDSDNIFEEDTVFNFDGNYGTNKAKRSLNNQDARYSIFSNYEAHTIRNGVNGDELWSTPLFQSFKQALKINGDRTYDEFNKILLESFYGLGYGIKMTQMADSIVKTALKIYPNENYASILLENFKKHKIIDTKVKYSFEKEFLDKNDTLKFTYSNKYFIDYYNLNTKFETSQLNLKKDALSNSEFLVNKEEQTTLEYEIPSSLTCSSKIDLKITNNFNYKDEKTQSDSLTYSFVYGKPSFEKLPIQRDVTIPNAKKSSNPFNPIIPTSMLFIMDNFEEVIKDDFAFILEVSSKSFADIKMQLITPANEKINLLEDESLVLKTNIKKVFTLNDKAFKNLKNKSYKGAWYLNIENKSLDNETILYRYGISKIKKYECN